jgi:hypothetical protein
MTTQPTIDQVKRAILSGMSRRMDRMAFDSAIELVCSVKQECEGFAKDVATTVAKFNNCSEKQAYVIARAYVEKGCVVYHGLYANNQF